MNLTKVSALTSALLASGSISYAHQNDSIRQQLATLMTQLESLRDVPINVLGKRLGVHFEAIRNNPDFVTYRAHFPDGLPFGMIKARKGKDSARNGGFILVYMAKGYGNLSQDQIFEIVGRNGQARPPRIVLTCPGEPPVTDMLPFSYSVKKPWGSWTFMFKMPIENSHLTEVILDWPGTKGQ